MSIRGARINWESLTVGERYILRPSNGEAVVRVDKKDVTGITVTVEEGQIKSLKQGKTYRKGEIYIADPASAEFFEPKE